MNDDSGQAGNGDGQAKGLSWHSLKTFESFKVPAYRIYYGAMAGQWATMSMQMVVRPLLAYRISESGTVLGVLSLASAIPLLIFSLYGGAIADRIRKKRILLAGQASSGAITLGIALALTFGLLSEDIPNSWWLLVFSAVLQGTVMGFMMPSRSAIIPEIVGEDKVMNAISLNNLGMNFFRLIGPALAGFIVAAVDFDAAYYLMTAMFAMGTTFAICLPRGQAAPARVNEGSTLGDIVDGLRYIRRQKTILLILIFSLFGMVFMFLMPMFTEDILKIGAEGLGLLMMISGFGAILCSLLLASLPDKKRGIMFIVSSLVLGLALVGFSFSELVMTSAIMIFIVGLGNTGQQALSITLAQSYTEATYRGRVLSFLMMGIGLASLGTFFAGILADAFGVQWALGGFAMMLALLALLVWIFALD